MGFVGSGSSQILIRIWIQRNDTVRILRIRIRNTDGYHALIWILNRILFLWIWILTFKKYRINGPKKRIFITLISCRISLTEKNQQITKYFILFFKVWFYLFPGHLHACARDERALYLGRREDGHHHLQLHPRLLLTHSLQAHTIRYQGSN